MCNDLPRKFLVECVDNVIDLSIENVKKGGLPFASFIINNNGNIIGKGVNQVSELMDCTAHAEVQAIREASRYENDVSLRGATLIASGEPCGLCYMAIRMARITKVVTVADRYEAEKNGFDYLWTYKYLNASLFRELEILKLESKRKIVPFQLAKNNFDDLVGGRSE